ncbi:hypothetical protein AAF712_016356 [Marasmius tenuissimus]|uniref:F-box domain-containing protein n=1 Tax=Marasmius tenuissimus TaxID=585030 RepID=A0ABR2Z6R0_9AGAR
MPTPTTVLHPRPNPNLDLNDSRPPICRLPREILVTIFTLTASLNRTDDTFLLKSGAGETAKPIKYDPQNQIAISHVCQQWRRLALAMPNLWNTLQFETYSDIERGRVFCDRLIRNTMVDILILTVSKKEYEDAGKRGQYLLWTQEMHEIFSMLAPHTWRFRSFHLQVHDGHCKAVARHYIGTKDGKIFGPAPNLETWQLYHFENFRNVGDLYEATRRKPVKCFEDQIPKLKNLSLIGDNLLWNSPYLKNLHSLELALHTNDIRPAYEHWYNMLSRSPDLRTLLLHYSGPQIMAGAKWPCAVVTLPKLETLGLVDLEPDHLEATTSRIDTPNIKKLEIELGDAEDNTVAYDGWLRSISTPGSLKFQSLVSLAITSLQCNDSDTLKMFLRTLRRLRELEMKYEVWSSVWRMFVEDLEWDERMTEDGDTEVAATSSGSYSSFILPELEVLKVRGTRIMDRSANVKLVLRREAGERQQGPIPGVDEDRLFTIVGTLPVHVKPPNGTVSDSSERNRQTKVLERLVGAKAEEEELTGGGEDQAKWKIYVYIEAITEDEEDARVEAGVEEDMEDVDDDELEAYNDDKSVDYSDDEDEEEGRERMTGGLTTSRKLQ